MACQQIERDLVPARVSSLVMRHVSQLLQVHTHYHRCIMIGEAVVDIDVHA